MAKRLIRYFWVLFCVAMAVWTVLPLSTSPCAPEERLDQPPMLGMYQTHCSFTPYSTIISLALGGALIVWDVVAQRKDRPGQEA